MGRVAALALAAGLLLAGTACGERSEPTGAEARVYPVTVQDAGDRRLVVTHAARRIVVLDPAAAAILRALGAGPRIVGTPPSRPADIDVAALRRLKPDLIVASGDTDERALSRAGEAAGATVYVAPADSIKGVERAISGLGMLVGRPVEARVLIRRIEAERRDVATHLARRPTVTVFVDKGFLTTISDHSLVGDLIREASGKNVAGPDPGLAAFDAQELRKLDPHVYLATSDAEVDLASLRSDPGTRTLSAVRQGRFGIVDIGLLEPGPRIGEGLAEIARLLHPDAFR